MKTHTMITATAIGATALVANAGDVPVQIHEFGNQGTTNSTIFNLFDHPGGAVDPQAYGLRLDSFAAEMPTTFSFEDGSGQSNVQLVVTDTGGGFEINISGTIWGNSADGGTDYGSFLLDLTYQVESVADGYEDNGAADGVFVGGLTGLNTTGDSPLGDGEFLDLFGMSDGSDAFRFLADGHRLMGDSDTWVGRGWLAPSGFGQGVNDLLFTAQIIPLPPAAFAGLGMLAGLGAYRRFRSRG